MPKLRRRWLEQEQRELLEEALADQDVDPATVQGTRLQGDPAMLRGVPVVGVPGGMGGAVPGTRPDTSRVNREDENRR